MSLLCTLFFILVVFIAAVVAEGAPSADAHSRVTPMAPSDGANSTKVVYLLNHRHLDSSNSGGGDFKYMYTSDYAYMCDAVAPGKTRYGHSEAACALLNSNAHSGGWLPATVPSAKAMAALRAALRNAAAARSADVGGALAGTLRASAHLGAILDTADNQTLRWTAGRLKGRPFGRLSPSGSGPAAPPFADGGAIAQCLAIAVSGRGQTNAASSSTTTASSPFGNSGPPNAFNDCSGLWAAASAADPAPNPSDTSAAAAVVLYASSSLTATSPSSPLYPISGLRLLAGGSPPHEAPNRGGVALGCVLCERSRCDVAADCYAPNTVSVRGRGGLEGDVNDEDEGCSDFYFPNCRCVCKPGAWGDKCQWPLAIDHGPYVSEYAHVMAAASPLTRAGATTACGALRSGGGGSGGWALASLPSRAAADALSAHTALFHSSDMNALDSAASAAAATGPAWVSARDGSTAAAGVFPRTWQWGAATAGGTVATRLAGAAFWTATAAAGVGSAVAGEVPTFDLPTSVSAFPQTNLWAPSQPTATAGPGRCGRLQPSAPLSNGPFTPNGFEETDCSATADAFICERSPCRLGTDCYEPNTIYMNTSEYYPNCKCACKEGSWGDRCEYPLLVPQGGGEGVYVSEYVAVCGASPSTTVGYDAARAGCEALRGVGSGGGGARWQLATFPTNASMVTFMRRTAYARRAVDGGKGRSNIWVAASDAAVANTWLWTAGRLEGTKFHSVETDGSHLCSRFSYHLQLPVLDNCGIWAPAQPDNAITPAVYAVIAPYYGPLMDDVPATFAAQCFACERSPCKLGLDCLEYNTATMLGDFFPNCTCVCKTGAFGQRCEWPLIVDNGVFTTEYRQLDVPSPGVNQAGSSDKCAATFGTGWHAATFATAASFAAYRRAVGHLPRLPAWIGLKRLVGSEHL